MSGKFLLFLHKDIKCYIYSTSCIGFLPEGWGEKHKSVLCAQFRHSQKCILGWIWSGGGKEAWLEVKSSCCSGSVGRGHAARAHMESRLNSSADSNCPSVVSLEKHASRQGGLAAGARYQSWSWFAPSKKEAWHKPAVRARVTVSTLVLTSAEAKPKWRLMSTHWQQRRHTKTKVAFMALNNYSKREVPYFQQCTHVSGFPPHEWDKHPRHPPIDTCI